MKDHEEIMREWDAARSIIARGDTSSRPRDWFENVISEKDAHIAAIEADLRSARQDRYPTQDAYDAACKALRHWRAEAERLGKLAGVEPRQMAKD